MSEMALILFLLDLTERTCQFTEFLFIADYAHRLILWSRFKNLCKNTSNSCAVEPHDLLVQFSKK